MRLSLNDLDVLAKKAIYAARQAGEIISQYASHPLSVQTKTGGESLASQVLTEVDLLCQEVILKILLPSCKQFDLALLSEECVDDKKRLEKDFFWSVDPLDGTLAFIESSTGYAVSIALVSRSGEALIGVIYDPIEQLLYHAIKRAGVFRNNKIWHLKKMPMQQQMTLTIVSDRSFLQQSYYKRVMSELEDFAQEMDFKGLETIQHGGAAMNACWVLENAPACYFKFPKPQNGGGSLWDYAASSCIFNEIGAYTSDIYGKPLALNRVESSFMNHQGILYASHKNIAEKVRKIYQKI